MGVVGASPITMLQGFILITPEGAASAEGPVPRFASRVPEEAVPGHDPSGHDHL